MKKSLFAMAALTAFAGAAQAQSSVTVYGILDVGYVGTSTRVGGSGNVPNYNGQEGSVTGVAKISNSRTQSNGFVGNGAETTSRLGFRGTEDLGGGTSAFFTVELAIAPQSEQGISTAATQNRQTFVGLKKNGIGAVSIGTQYTPVHRAVGLTDPGQQNNVAGNVIYSSPTGSFATPGNGATGSYTVRTNNMLFAESDTFAGFKANAFYSQNNSNSTVTGSNGARGLTNNDGEYTGGTNNQSGFGLGLNYAWQKLLVTANYQSLNSKNPYGALSFGLGTVGATNTVQDVTTYTGSSAAWVNSSGGTNIKDNQQYYAATYDFGVLKAFAGYINRKATSQQDATQYASRSAQQIGVRSFITPTIEAWASGGSGRLSAFGGSEPTANFNGWQLGSNYLLSKRTNLYAIYGQTITSTAAVSNVVSGSPGTVGAGTGTINGAVSQYAVGIRHTF